jgi:hypothetical protein
MKFSLAKLQEIVKQAKSEPTAEDLMKRPCCGSGCTNCPYSPKHKKGNTTVRDELKKSARIEKDPKSGKWILWTKDGKRKLGTHDSPEDAYKQEYAIEKSMEKKSAFILPKYFTKSSTINGTEEDLKASKSPVEGVKEDRKYVTITKPLKSPLSGFITNSKGKLATPDKRFNLINGERKLIKKSANKFTKLLRGGILRGTAEQSAKLPMHGNLNKGLRANDEYGKQLGELRQIQKTLDARINSARNSPASEVYNSDDTLLAGIRNVDTNAINPLKKLLIGDASLAQIREGRRVIPKRKAPQKSSFFASLDNWLYRKWIGKQSWKDPKLGFTDKARARKDLNEIYAPANSLSGRHELGHVVQIPLRSKDLTKYNRNIYLPLRMSEKLGGKEIKNRILGSTTALDELRTQFHATKGTGNKAKAIREATGAVKIKGLDPIRQRAEDLIAKQPHMEDNIRATLSALEHLSSNYVMPLK